MPRLIYCVFWFFSHMPLFRTIDESNFGEIKRSSEVIQFNFFSVSFGTKIYCLLYFQLDLPMLRLWANRTPRTRNILHFGWGKVISLQQLQPRISDQELLQKRNDFENILRFKVQSQKDTLAETIMYKINDSQITRGKNFNKFLAYLAIIALLIPIYVPYILRIEEIINKPFLVSIFYGLSSMVIFFSLSNVLIFSYEFVKVQTYRKFLFRSIKDAASNDTSIKYISGLYYDWQESQNTTTKEVTIIKNMEKYLTQIVICSIIILLGTVIININNNFEKKYNIVSESKNEIHFLDSSLETQTFLKKSYAVINQIQDGLLRNEYKELIIISAKGQTSDNYQRILEILKAYNSNSIKIIEINTSNDTTPRNEIQIITIRR